MTTALRFGEDKTLNSNLPHHVFLLPISILKINCKHDLLNSLGWAHDAKIARFQDSRRIDHKSKNTFKVFKRPS